MEGVNCGSRWTRLRKSASGLISLVWHFFRIDKHIDCDVMSKFRFIREEKLTWRSRFLILYIYLKDPIHFMYVYTVWDIKRDSAPERECMNTHTHTHTHTVGKLCTCQVSIITFMWHDHVGFWNTIYLTYLFERTLYCNNLIRYHLSCTDILIH